MIDRSQYPPAPVAFVLLMIDNCTYFLGNFFWNWREWMPFVDHREGWLSNQFRMETRLANVFPAPLSFGEYLQQRQLENVTLSSLFDYAFRTPSTSLSVLTTPQALAVVAVLVFAIRRIKAVVLPFFSNIGRNVARSTHGPEWETQPANEVRIVKFGEYVFRLLFHSSISIFGVLYSYDKQWWQPGGTHAQFDGYPFQPTDPGMTWYYLIQCAYNAEAMISLLDMSLRLSFQSLSAPSVVDSSSSSSNTTQNGNEMDTRTEKSAGSPSFFGLRFPIKVTWKPTVRGDFQEMAIHHLVTNALVFASSYCRLTRTGSMVFLVHDISDIPIDASKLAHFLKYKKTTTVCFVTMVLCWMVARLYVLPFTIYRSVWMESEEICNTGVVHPVYYLAYYFLFLFLLGLLILLHLVWFFMFLKMGYLLFAKGEQHDLSEHKKGEEQSSSAENGSNGDASKKLK